MKLIHKFLISSILNLAVNTSVFGQKPPKLFFSVLIKVFDSTRTSKEIILLNKETMTVGQNIKQNNSIIYVEFSTKYLNYKNSTIIYKISKNKDKKLNLFQMENLILK